MLECVSEEDGVSDQELMDYFTTEKMWGMECFVNLYGCDRTLISDENVMRNYIIDLCDFIKMKRYGEPMIEKFGEGDLFGFSFVQLIYTSSLVGHCVEKTGDVYLDVFSCKEFQPSAVAEFSKNYFKAKDVKHGTLFRE
jgi:S-adenosylmethionine/arginine decarboxylase-like enzyme